MFLFTYVNTSVIYVFNARLYARNISTWAYNLDVILPHLSKNFLLTHTKIGHITPYTEMNYFPCLEKAALRLFNISSNNESK